MATASSPIDTAPGEAEAVAGQIRDAFADYHARFAAITRRAQGRFERSDWQGDRADAVERIELYDRCIAEASNALQARLGERAGERVLWSAVHAAYAQTVAPLLDGELYKTFFNTLTRRFFKTRGVDPSMEFVALDIEPTDAITHPVARHSYAVSEDRLVETFMRVLDDYPFAVPYAHRTRCAAGIAVRLQEDLQHWGPHPVRAVELLDTVFYRERRAYLIGRVFGERSFSPCVIALVNEDGALKVDAVLTVRSEVVQLFSYSRSYFHADLGTVGDAVVFLRTLLPGKPIDELYTVLGRAKQGKTERYRTFFRQFAAQSGERLIRAEGERGMVMAVFTLPSYPLVFKIIRDHFAYPKEVAREEVEAKYSLVFHHDRVGRLVDAQPFRFLRFPRSRFAPDLLDELLSTCAKSISLDGDDLVLHLCYVERRLRPLNLYVREQTPEAARAAVIDYGQAIRDLALSNIFPGDLLLKNFGVSRHGRAIFYDYDELCLVSDCRFRPVPAPRNHEEEMESGAWFYAHGNDVFPEQFPRFLGLSPPLLGALMHAHGDIFKVEWWKQVQDGLASGQHNDVAPYPSQRRLP
ncbi:isocitrate dehydrogenase kinase/phosphatase family protein [Lysobacter capsici]|uniref:bifunctional isocitrate dehydrogenase kinase/phosphatase n=1 Tax=Lysobacter capsici TaxID=435897 RepID=UPI00071640E8|nr:bifunctional isocitrate dehydrogenase kinase/phosphatase [Lysobacter capsici]ALN88944.1 isocitrate dehydrogenase kinase/phosphatase family protein [Lysobacter capsici]